MSKTIAESVPGYMKDDFMMTCSVNGLSVSSYLGEGSFGLVYAGKRSMPYPEDVEGTNNYAIKLAWDVPKIHGQLEREVSVLQKFSHPNIVKAYQDRVLSNGERYKIIVMERLEMTLENYILARRVNSLPEPETRYIIRQVVDGLLYIHDQGYAHRDLKTENVLMSKDPKTGEWIAKICDLGFVNNIGDLTTGLGTPNYMAPEIAINIKCNDKYGPEVDLWALGVMTYKMLTGNYLPKYDGTNPQAVLFSTKGFQLPESFSFAARSFVSSLLTTMPIDRMTFQALKEHPFLLNDLSVTVALPGKGNEPPVLRTLLLPKAALISSNAIFSVKAAGPITVPWRDIAATVLRKLATWRPAQVPSAAPEDLLAFTAAGERIDLRTAVFRPAELWDRSQEVFMTFPGVTGSALVGTHCSAPPTNFSHIWELIPRDATTPPQQGFAPDLRRTREAARRGSQLIFWVREKYSFAVNQCALAHKAITFLEKACTARAQRLEEVIQRALDRLEKCRVTGAAGARAFLYALIPRDTAEILDFNTRGRAVLERVWSFNDSFRTYLGFDDVWARHNVGKLAEVVRCLEPAVAAFDAEFGTVLDAFTEYWNTFAREVAALEKMEDLELIARGIADAPEDAPDEEVMEMTARYSEKLSDVMESLPTWAVRPCSLKSGQTGQVGQAQALSAAEVAEEEYKRRIEALRKEKERLLQENKLLKKKLSESNKKKNIFK